MKKTRLAVAIAALAYCLNAQAWVHNDGVRIVQMVQWENDNPIYFKLSNNNWCYIPAAEKNLYALLLSMHAAGTSANFVCYDTADPNATLSAHRLHRVWTLEG